MSDLRDAVQREIDAYRPSTTPPFDTIRIRKQTRDRRNIVAGAVLVLTIIGGAILLPDRTSDLAVPAERNQSTRTPDVAETPTSAPTPIDDPSQEPSGSGEPVTFPERLVLSEGTALVVDGVQNSDPRILERYEPASEGGPNVLAAVELSPDGSTVYAEVCCEPASGYTQPMNINSPDTEFEPVFASWPALSPDGSTLAAFSLDTLTLYDVAAGHSATTTVEPGAGNYVRQGLTWSRDGMLLAVTEAPLKPSGLDPKEGVPWQIRLLNPQTATALDDGRVMAAPNGQAYVAPVFRRDGMLVVARQYVDPDITEPATAVVLHPADGRIVSEFALDGRVVDQDYDRSGTFLLTTYSDGRVSWKGAGSEGVLRRSGPTIAASW